MPERLNCPEGHEWDFNFDEENQSLSAPVTCPICGFVQPLHQALALREPSPDQVVPVEQASAVPRTRGPSAEVTEPTPHTPTLLVDPGTLPRFGPISLPRLNAIPGYDIEEELGRGGMGVVYKARQQGLNRTVALKMILAADHAGLKDRERFRQEAELIAQLEHPHIVQIYQVGEADGRPFFSMEFVAGGSLAQQLAGVPWPARSAVQLVVKLADGIHKAHQRGIVHRDLKPANVLLTADGIPKITDFGLAKKLDDAAGPTQSGTILGTPSYMAPEQAEGKAHRIGPAADIYALGAILYELLTGRPPFRAETPMETLLQVINTEPVPPRRLLPKLPRDLETICLKCLQKEPQARYADARQLADDLERFLAGIPIKARPVSWLERGVKWAKRHPSRVGLGVLVGLLGIVAVTAQDPLLGLIALTVPLATIGLAIVLAQWRQAQIQRHLAEEQRLQAEAARRETEAQRLEAEAARREAEEQARKAAQALASAQANLYFLQIALAERELTVAHVARAEAVLAACPTEHRHWEWHYLKRLCHGELSSWKAHKRSVLCVACSPDGQQVASAGWDRAIILWNTLTGQPLRTLVAHTAQVTSLAFSPNGRWLASAGGDEVIRLWDAVTGQTLQQLRGHSREVTGVAFGLDGQLLASASADQTVRLWDAASGRELLVLQGHRGPVLDVAFHPHEAIVASVGEESTIRLWDAVSGRELVTCRGHDGKVLQAAFAPDGRTLATAGWDRTVKLWDWANGQEIAVLRGHAGIVTSVAFWPDGRRLATSSEDRTVKVWDARNGPEARCLRGHSKGVLCAAFSPDSRFLVSGSGRPLGKEPGEVKLWDVEQGVEVLPLAGPKQGVHAVAFSPDGLHFASGHEDGSILLWSAITGKKEGVLRGHTHSVIDLVYNHDGSKLLSAAEDGLAKVWDPHHGRELTVIRPNLGPLLCAAWSADGRYLALAGRDRVQRRTEAKLWDLAANRELWTLGKPAETVLRLVFSPDGQQFASAHRSATLRLWNVADGRELKKLRGHADMVTALAFSPDGKRLVSAGHDRTLKLWDLASGHELLTLRGHSAEITAVQFSPNGHHLVSASTDETLRIWNGTPLTSPDSSTAITPSPAEASRPAALLGTTPDQGATVPATPRLPTR